MKKCPYCKIEVDGALGKCPLCQSKLMGEDEENYFPRLEEQKKRTIFYKIQLFIAWVILIVGVGLDFMIGLRLPTFPDLHWSLLLAMWMVAIEFGIMRQFKPGTGSAGKVTIPVLITLSLLLITAHYLRFFDITADLVVPIILAVMIVADFVLAMLDKYGNTMAFLLTGVLIGAIPSLIRFIIWGTLPLPWTICMIISVVLFAGTVIFKGKPMAEELRRRFNV